MSAVRVSGASVEGRRGRCARALARLAHLKLGVVATLGITHNLLFHPVAVGAIALALAMGAPDPDQRAA